MKPYARLRTGFARLLLGPQYMDTDPTRSNKPSIDPERLFEGYLEVTVLVKLCRVPPKECSELLGRLLLDMSNRLQRGVELSQLTLSTELTKLSSLRLLGGSHLRNLLTVAGKTRMTNK